jgi:hypothetical protein
LKVLTRLSCALVFTASVLAQAAAPTVPGPERLPADTWVLINWHGVADATRVRATNPVMRLWDDPQFASVREDLVQMLSQRVGGGSPLSRARVDDMMSLLENPVVIGVTGDLIAAISAPQSQPAASFFAILNKQGKEAAWSRLHAERKPGPDSAVSNLTLRGVQVRKSVTTKQPAPTEPGGPPAQPKVSTSFEATLGEYELFTDQQATMESMIARLQEKTPIGKSLRDNVAFQKAQRFRAQGPLLEFFVQVPDLSRLPIPPVPQIDVNAVLRELHTERLEGVSISVGMARDQMQLRGAMLGDMTPGSLLDVIGGNATSFATLAAAPATGTYSVYRFDLPALYATLLRAVRAGLPPDQASAAPLLVDSMVAAQTGMRMTELLALFSGEVAMVSNGEDMLRNELPELIMAPVAKSEAVLGLIKTFAGQLVRAQETLAGATVLSVGSPQSQAQANGETKDRAPTYVAVAPTLLVVSPKKPVLADALARAEKKNAAPAGSLAADPKFQAVRKTLPAELNGLGYTDLSRAAYDNYLQALREVFAARKDAEEAARINKMFDSVLPLVKKHLKVSVGGTWKAGDGVYHHSYIN